MSGTFRILLVEDNPGDAHLVAEALRADDVTFEVTHVERLDDAIGRLSADPPDAVILDLNLPDSDGLDTFRAVHREAPTVPVLVMTVVADERSAISALRLGAQDWLYKSELTGRALPRLVRYAIERHVARNELAELVRELQRLISHAAHDLGDPVAAVAGLADLLDADRTALPPDELDGLVGLLRRQARRLGDLVADLLDIARVHADVELDAVVVRDALDEALHLLPSPDGVRVTTDVPDSVAVLATPRGLERLLTNLLSNAYRHAGSEVEVSVRPDGDAVAIVVADDGQGVPAEFEARLFDDFARGPNVTDGSGTGLGLSIARRLARTFGGDITHRANGGGATFEVELVRSAR